MKFKYYNLLTLCVIGLHISSCANKKNNYHNMELETSIYMQSKLYPTVSIPANIKRKMSNKINEKYKILYNPKEIAGVVGINPLPPTLAANHG